MRIQSIQSELRDFVLFASRLVEFGNNRILLEELVRQWRLGTELAETVADVQQGIIDDAERKAQMSERGCVRGYSQQVGNCRLTRVLSDTKADNGYKAEKQHHAGIWSR